MQQGRGGMGSRKHGISGHATQSPRLRLMKRLSAERGEYGSPPQPRSTTLRFGTVRDALKAERKPR
jgi:hypothetical protein